MSFTGLLMLLG